MQLSINIIGGVITKYKIVGFQEKNNTWVIIKSLLDKEIAIDNQMNVKIKSHLNQIIQVRFQENIL